MIEPIMVKEYLNNCVLPLNVEPVNVIYLDERNPTAKVTGKTKTKDAI
jgi:hypothetical protein